MQIEPMSPSGPWLVIPSALKDDRGEFFRYYCERTFRDCIPGFTGFVQCNQSVNVRKATLRGMHYQMPPHAEDKLVRCIKGAAWDVCIDLRKDSPTFLKWFAAELTETNRYSIFIPKGFAHGFITLSNNTELIYHHSEYYVPGAEKGIHFADPAVGIVWPEVPQTVSEKDAGYAFLDKNFTGIEI